MRKGYDTRRSVTHGEGTPRIPFVRFQVLGPLRGWADAAELALGPPKQRSLLALLLVKAGFFLDGYGSNFITEATTQVGNEYLDLPALDFEEIVARAVKQWA